MMSVRSEQKKATVVAKTSSNL